MARRPTVPAVGTQEARALDAQARDRFHVSTRLLMENAGAQCAIAVARLLARAQRRVPGGAVHVHCGAGGNGGDGYVCARHLALQGIPVRVHPTGAPAPGSDAADARRSWDALAAAMPPMELPACALVVDAVLGIGVLRPAEGAALAAIRAIMLARLAGATVVSLDVPSGVCTETGAPLGEAVAADCTLLIAAPKKGLCRRGARAWTGKQIIVPFGAPARILPSGRS